MSSRILLVNFGDVEQQRLAKLNLDVDLGILSDAWGEPINNSSGNIISNQTASYYFPYSVYEYKVVFVKLTKHPPFRDRSEDELSLIDEKQIITCFRYWHKLNGILVIFIDDGSHVDLNLLGFPYAHLGSLSGVDRTINSYKKVEGKEPQRTFKELVSSVKIPPYSRIIVPNTESEYNVSRRWRIFTPYVNNNRDKLGIYLDWGLSFEAAEKPQLFILPAYKDYGLAIEKFIKSLARIHPRQLPEVIASDWTNNDSYFPKAVSDVEAKKKDTYAKFKSQLALLEKEKEELKNNYSYIIELLLASGDELKEAVIRVLNEIFKLKAIDLDENKKSDFREDISIEDEETGNIMFAEVKGTRNQNPTFAYILQLEKNLRRRGNKDLVGALILNYDLTKEPQSRPEAYTSKDEQEAIKDIIFIDTRVLFYLALAIIDHDMRTKEAKEILLKKGRVVFNLKQYLKNRQ